MTYNNGLRASAIADGRTAERVPTELQTIVQVREGDGETWKEVVKVTTVSRNGAGFSLARPVIVGRLVTLVLPLDPELRAYDKDREVYPVMGIVQHCNKATVDGVTVFHTGVGFIGKQVPESFKNDPTQNFRITGMTTEGLWKVAEADAQFKKRRHPRYWIGLGVTISLLRKADNSGAKEETHTVNIAGGGVSVVCTLEAAVGDKVKFACKAVDFYAIAVVRNRKERKGELPTLHLEFVDAVFPVEKVVANPGAAYAE
ncbi:MAG: PilZ domain-containing protein [Pyrinomonadaceae bacterium]|nr:PilZ domain-containing protein [Pyrinomonadaceae bacterium]